MKSDFLVLSPVSQLGGVERVAFQVARAGRRRGLSVEAWFKAPIQSSDLVAMIAAEGIRTSETPNLKPLGVKELFRSMMALRKEVRSTGARAVNLHNPGNTILASDVLALRLAGVKRIVCSLHHPLDPATLPSSWKVSTAIASRMATCIVVTTPILQETVEDMGVSERKFRQIPLAIEEPSAMLTKAEARKEFHLPQDKFIVGTLARLVPPKRIDAIIRSCAASQAFRESGHLAIGGSGECEGELRSLANRLLPNQVSFLGQVPEASRMYPALDLFALTSELEGFGLVYAEAALHGVPSVGCDSGGTRYAIQNGKGGWLLPVDSPEELQGIIEYVLLEPSSLQMRGEAARSYVRDTFSVQKFEEAYLGLLGF